MAKDVYHNIVKEALVNDGWTITSDPYKIKLEDNTKYEIDLGADKVIAASKANEKIAVEIKSFIGQSLPYEFHGALGQFMNYLFHIQTIEPDRKLYLAISTQTYILIQKKFSLLKVLDHYKVSLIVFDISTKSIEEWITR